MPEAGACPEPPERRDRADVPFWDEIGRRFPSLKGAGSTAYYLECEQMLHKEFFPPLKDRLLFKTDLWDEAKNTEILRWGAEQGARPAALDVAFSTVKEARTVLQAYRPMLVVSDIRAAPFRSDSFDLVYSMGTTEHFQEYDVAVREIFRVLKPGGRGIIGVPNRLDPFLRPLMVAVLRSCGCYAYGSERSFTAGGLRALVEAAGFHVHAMSGILFIPGWLRMLDLLCYTRCPPLANVTRVLVRPFAWCYRRFPGVRRHGYLLACVVDKPARVGPAHRLSGDSPLRPRPLPGTCSIVRSCHDELAPDQLEGLIRTENAQVDQAIVFGARSPARSRLVDRHH